MKKQERYFLIYGTNKSFIEQFDTRKKAIEDICASESEVAEQWVIDDWQSLTFCEEDIQFSESTLPVCIKVVENNDGLAVQIINYSIVEINKMKKSFEKSKQKTIKNTHSICNDDIIRLENKLKKVQLELEARKRMQKNEEPESQCH